MSNQPAGSRPAEVQNLRLIGHSDLNGYGDGMQLLLKDTYLYVGHLGKMGTTILDVSDPTSPRVVQQLKNPPNTHNHKVQIGGDILIVNFEKYPRSGDMPDRAGIQILDISDRVNPREIGFFSTGGRGVHRLFYNGGPYVYLSAEPEGYTDQIMFIVDISDPTQPREVSRWWIPGMWTAGGEEPTWPKGLRYAAHHPNVWQDRAYWGFWDAGVIIMDISDPAHPKQISRLSWAPEEGGNTHTALPLPNRNLLVVTDESTKPECQESPRRVRLLDISDETQPKVISKFPEPQGDFCRRGLRFGPHNVHENQPGAFSSDEIIFVTYFNAGLRVFDISDPETPQEIAYYIPQTPAGQPAVQTNDVFVAENGLIYITDRVSGGVDILEMTL
jgi:hypothetical protein